MCVGCLTKASLTAAPTGKGAVFVYSTVWYSTVAESYAAVCCLATAKRAGCYTALSGPLCCTRSAASPVPTDIELAV